PSQQQQNSPQQGKKPQPSTTRGNGKPLSRLKAGLIQLTLLISFFSLLIQWIWGTGTEVKCAIGVAAEYCLTPGIDWSSQMVVIAAVLTIVALMLLQDTDK